ncbi:MAG TPA: hypothetical protein VJ866_11095 [Pyrinomonadaceae bacterium]|nr:hypothetical protein [Pyrinomonadaceae bacterium]
MTPQDHNKVIGIMHLIYGGFNAMMMLLFVPIFLFMGAAGASDPGAPPALMAIFGFFGLLMLFCALLFGLPPILAGYAMLKRKSWARVMSIIAACVEALSFPFGTALCVYTLWFHFGQGEHFYRGGGYDPSQNFRAPLRDSSTYDWETRRAADASRQQDYAPPQQPPDWR